VFYGGYIGAVVFPLLYLRLVREPILPLMDIAATYLPAGLAAHRAFGCLSAGCCYGRPTDAPWGIVFPADSMPAGAYGQVPLHPTQLYEAGLGLCMFAVLLYWRKHRRVAAGELFALQMAMYAVGRFIIEIYRGDLERGRFGPLTTSQWISVIMLVVAAGLAAHAWRERRAVKGAT
jgi:phosphatidylglycerol:prolipoprotein diacylglycerol transferase